MTIVLSPIAASGRVRVTGRITFRDCGSQGANMRREQVSIFGGTVSLVESTDGGTTFTQVGAATDKTLAPTVKTIPVL